MKMDNKKNNDNSNCQNCNYLKAVLYRYMSPVTLCRLPTIPLS